MEELVEEQKTRRNIKSVIWGLSLIALGSLFLVDRLGLVELPAIWQLWPLIFVVFAAIRLIDRRYGRAVCNLMLGAWFLACTFEWYGLTYYNSWPLLVVVAGTGMVIGALTGEDEKWKEKWRQRRAEAREAREARHEG